MSAPQNTPDATGKPNGEARRPHERMRLLTQGLACLEKREFRNALIFGEQAVALNTKDYDAWHLVGVALAQMGQHARGIEALQQAATLMPTHAQLHTNLGNIYYEQANLAQAIVSFRRALELDRGAKGAAALLATCCERELDLGIEHHRTGRSEEAAACYNSVLTGQPQRADAWNLLGVLAYQRGDCPEAIKFFERALQINPSVSSFHRNMGSALLMEDKPEEALSFFEAALRLEPDSAENLANAGLCQYRNGRLEAAEASLRTALAKNPDFVPALVTLTDLLFDAGRFDDAMTVSRRARVLDPGDAKIQYRYARALRERGMHSEALDAVAESLAIDSEAAATHNLLGQLKKDLGRPEEAIPAYRRATDLAPEDAKIQSNLLYALNYHDGLAPEEVFAEHLAWANRHEHGAQPAAALDGLSLDPDRPLRIGYVSGDLRAHSVAFFFEPLLAGRNRSATHVTCYSNNANQDRVTERLQRLSDGWRVIKGKSDDEVGALIRDDRIDILVDLSGHTRANRMPMFAQRIAPIQVTYLGYPNTSGLATMDYRFTDAIADPPGLTEAFHSEELIRLDGCFLCYRPPDDSPPVSRSPAATTGRISFGSFNNLAKLNAALIAQWAAILVEVPNSRLVLKSKPFADQGAREFVSGLFRKTGIAAERIVFSGWAPNTRNHLERYGEIDIALDTFPYNGATTTCECLWMGVPVITCAGQTHASRVGASLLTAIGLDEFIAVSMKSYVQAAIALAQDTKRLEELRMELRPRMAASVLTDGAHLARSVEAAYRTMWRRLCSVR
jgi:predicted O-linked N-acetylglucosamine transferase (SPINDLY family)